MVSVLPELTSCSTFAVGTLGRRVRPGVCRGWLAPLSRNPRKPPSSTPGPACEQSHRVAINWRSPTPRDDGREPDVLIGVEEEEEEVGAP